MSTAAVRLFNPLRSAFAAAPKVRRIRGFGFNNRTDGLTQYLSVQEKKYTEQHEWVELSADNTTATVGITEYAAKALGDVVYVELPALDSKISAGETFGAVESVKSASDIMSPVSGTVVDTNTALDEKPKIVNESPEADGWFVKIQVTDPSEVEGLMDEASYKASLEEEE
ncbi:glycine cleavage system H-protein subunit [Emydomyces testavorans]|uniref:Glycine cleavage system H protein n=1 Tax=Emydomyces testavorans TaxID=2070801 RepID=A0AAF0DNN2_9EURO|nr:glycine cleavage system H-protein subunit [Emydomyces testavorans]